MKHKLSFLISLFISTYSFSQIDFNKLVEIKLGESYKSSKSKVEGLFNSKPKILKGDFMGTHQIIYENLPFDYYGDANYVFEYVKDNLVSVNIDFQFKIRDSSKFDRLLNSIFSDIKNNSRYEALKDYQFMNLGEMRNYLHKEWVLNSHKVEMNYKPIKTKNFGYNAYSIKPSNPISTNFFIVTAGLVEIHQDDRNIGINRENIFYNGGVAALSIIYLSEQTQSDYNSKNELTTISYSEEKNEINQINLKFENGVYKLPVNLNNALTIDFVLDLGVSDVSISPDVFLVLFKAGKIDESDFIGSQTYQLADGTNVKSKLLNIKTLKIGNIELKNIRASIANTVNSPLLLGQSALKKLGGYRIDNVMNLLIIE